VINPLRLAQFLACLELCAACTSTNPVYDGSTVGPEAAVICGSGLSLAGSFGVGDAGSVSIREVDGVPTRRAKSQRVRPGKHVLGIEARTTHAFAVGYIDLQAQPRHEYTLTAQQHGIGFLITVFDTTDDEHRVEIKQIKLLKSGEFQGTRSASMPMYIPFGARN